MGSDKAKTLAALAKYRGTNADIADCILAAHSTETQPVVSFDKDFRRLKATCETL